ncbi:DoxX family protein [Fredinandcohnia sp. QZ13]|uniref:DoxX family protein n=1 Tax=Fredinandcohnia sp. QZ13 TaxID=3073144 RepID=UPI0028537036|nr:DoxX family protein [Fredinandcohnia sp. QZ13]MDR4886754.1 DoxX family protein [Fredinandcohnia sp. QZ13]
MQNKFELGSLIIRVVLGITFFVHGLVKFQDGIENTVGWFDSIGLPGVLAYGVAGIELVGGIMLVLGLFSRIVSILFAIVMVGAIIKVKLAIGFLGNGQMAGYELDLAFLAMAVMLAITGSKAFALDQLISKGKENTTTSIN